MPGILPKLIVVRGGSSQTRIAQACDRCRSKKIRCDGIRPCCSQCANVGFECKTSDKLSRRAFPRGYTESLEERVRSLEREVRELKDLLDLKDEQLDMLSRLHSFGSYSPPASATSSSSIHKTDTTPSVATSSPKATTDCSVSPITHHHPPHQLREVREISPGDIAASSEPATSRRSGDETYSHLAPPSTNSPPMANLARTRSLGVYDGVAAHASNRNRHHSISYDGPATSAGWQQWQQDRNNDPSTDEWERMLAMIDASHAAHIYGDSAGLAHVSLRHLGYEGRAGATGERISVRDRFEDPPFDGLAEPSARSQHLRGYPKDVMDGAAAVMVDDGWGI